MILTIGIEGANIHINGIGLEDLLLRVYMKGKEDGLINLPATKVTFIMLSKELAAQGRHIF